MNTTIAFAQKSFRPSGARHPLRAGLPWAAAARAERAPCLPGLAICLLVTALALQISPARAATNDLTSTLQRGLFEEEANLNLGAAIQAYQAVASQFDKDRKLAATAIFRLGECYRKQGNTNNAAVQYERILREFSDQPTLVTLSRQTLVAMGTAPAVPAAPILSDAARQEQKRLLEEEIRLVQKQLETQKRQVEAGRIPSDAIVPTERDLLKLKRQVAALDAGQPISFAAAEISAPAASSEADEVHRIQALIKESPDLINAPDRTGQTLLQSAAAKGKLAVVKLLLDSGAAVDGLQQPGLTALHYAAANGHKAVVDLLLGKGARPDAQNTAGVTPLHLASLKGYESVAKTLLAAHAPVNDLTKTSTKSEREDLQYSLSGGMSPLHLAAEGGYAGLVELLLAKGANTNTGDQTPLSRAARKLYLPVMELLLAAHADPNAGKYDLPLAAAAFNGEMPMLKLLLANGADPNAKSLLTWQIRMGNSYLSPSTAFSPLFLAVSQRQSEAVAELLRAKADPSSLDPRGRSLLFEAVPHAPTLKVLLEGGADPNPPDQGGESPLLQAVGATNQPAVELLLAHKADPNAGRTASSEDWTPLQVAAVLGTKPIAELLLNAGADINLTNKYGATPLHTAIVFDQRELVALLLARKADPNAKSTDGATPLHIAVQRGKQDLVELLLANKADPNERDDKGRTPLDLAKRGPQPALPGRAPIRLGPALPSAALGGIVPVAPGAQEREGKEETMAGLLRRHGALDDLPHLDRIGVRRSAIGFSDVPFTKGAQDWNQFTLLELVAVQYKLLASSPKDGGGASYVASVLFGDSRLPFPDLAHLHISRPTSNLKSWQDQVVDLRPVLESGDCAKDARLTWGDVVEIPEADHPLNERWGGFSAAQLANLKKCLTRQVEIVVKGQATSITLAPRITGLEEGQAGKTPVIAEVPSRPGGVAQVRYQPSIYSSTPFWLKPVLLQSKLVLVSSDLARVKVTRRDAATGQPRQWVVDCSEPSPAPDFWLQDGDRIEVPEKAAASGAE